MEISNISVSRRDVWKQCTQQYKYQYHLKLVPEEPEPIYFAYGTLVHKAAELYVSQKGEVQLQEIADNLIKGVIPINEDRGGKSIFAPKIPADYLKRLPGHLRAIQRISEQMGMGGQTEYRFEYDLNPPHNNLLKGVIDRLVQKKDKFWIVDYKTTKKGRWRKKSVINDLQLRCYSRVVQRQFEVPANNIMAALYYLEGSELVAARFSEEDLLSAEQELLNTYKEIENTPPENAWGNVGEWCSRCNYKKICPFLRIT